MMLKIRRLRLIQEELKKACFRMTSPSLKNIHPVSTPFPYVSSALGSEGGRTSRRQYRGTEISGRQKIVTEGERIRGERGREGRKLNPCRRPRRRLFWRRLLPQTPPLLFQLPRSYAPSQSGCLQCGGRDEDGGRRVGQGTHFLSLFDGSEGGRERGWVVETDRGRIASFPHTL